MHPRLTFALALSAVGLPSPLAAQATSPPTGSRGASASAIQLPSVTLPPELDRVLRDYERAWRAGDASALAALFAEDGFVLQGGRQPVRGRAGIRAAYAGSGGGPLRLRALAYATSDTVGYIVGAYGYDGSTGDQGKFTLTLRRSPAGRWLIFSDMDNASRPPRGSGASPSAPPPDA